LRPSNSRCPSIADDFPQALERNEYSRFGHRFSFGRTQFELRRKRLLMSLKAPPTTLARAHGRDRMLDMGRKWVETFELWADLNTKDRVLDVGCGPGRMAIAIREKFG
jgi:2-polyprenyl-3-methyl-5-hydroxy-6-metoxy-1,4-benzoquinol methylase